MPFIPSNEPQKEETCHHPEHNPPTMIVLPEGRHAWQCPYCFKITSFIVHKATL